MARKTKSTKRRVEKKGRINKIPKRKRKVKEENEIQEESYAVFDVGKEKFAINLDTIKEILHTFNVMNVPHLPEMFSGVVKLRGESVPVVDLQNLLKQTTTGETERPCLIAKIGDSTMGFLVDSDVSIITKEQFKVYPLPDCFTREEIEFFEGILRIDNTFVGILKPREMLEILAQWRQGNEKV